MPQLNLKPSHKAIRDYYATLRQYDRHSVRHEGAVSSPFETLLTVCAKQVDATLIPQFAMRAPSGNRIVLDGVILDEYGLPFAYWEAKDQDFWGFANAGAQLADIHVNYESAPKYDGLKYIETPGMPIDWRVEKMKLSKDKTQLKYNAFDRIGL